MKQDGRLSVEAGLVNSLSILLINQQRFSFLFWRVLSTSVTQVNLSLKQRSLS